MIIEQYGFEDDVFVISEEHGTFSKSSANIVQSHFGNIFYIPAENDIYVYFNPVTSRGDIVSPQGKLRLRARIIDTPVENYRDSGETGIIRFFRPGEYPDLTTAHVNKILPQEITEDELRHHWSIEDWDDPFYQQTVAVNWDGKVVSFLEPFFDEAITENIQPLGEREDITVRIAPLLPIAAAALTMLLLSACSCFKKKAIAKFLAEMPMPQLSA